MIQFNNHREEIYEHYQNGKYEKKNEEAKSGTKKAELTGSQYSKLYKNLGQNNRNKDVRKQLQEEVDMYTDNQLSTSFQMNQTPGYTMDKHN